MIHQTKLALQQLMAANTNPTSDLRDYKTIRKGDWKNVPILEQPSISIEWGGTLGFEQLFNPFKPVWNIQLVIKATEPRDPDLLAEKLEKLLWDMNSTSDWGLIPFLRDNRRLTVNGFTVLLTPHAAEPIVEANPDNSFSGSCIVTVNCTTEMNVA